MATTIQTEKSFNSEWKPIWPIAVNAV